MGGGGNWPLLGHFSKKDDMNAIERSRGHWSHLEMEGSMGTMSNETVLCCERRKNFIFQRKEPTRNGPFFNMS